MAKRLIRSVLGLLILLLMSACSEQKEEIEGQVTRTNGLKAPAELISLQEVTVGPPNINRMWQFKIEMLAKENSMVKQGEPVLRFDGQDLQNRLLSRISGLDAAVKEAEKKQLSDVAKKQDLALAVAEALMNKEKAQRKVEITDLSRSDIERRKQQAEYQIATEVHRQATQKLRQHEKSMLVNKAVSLARIDNLRVRVEDIQQSIKRLTVLAPKDGMVVYLANNEGKPAVGETVYMGRTLLSLPSPEHIAVKVKFDESDTRRVSIGSQVKVSLDSHPEKVFVGKVTSLGQSYRNKSNNNLKVVFDARVELERLDTSIMRPGMKATVELVKDTEALGLGDSE